MKASWRTPRQFTMAHGLMVLAGIITFLTVSSVLRDRNETVMVVIATSDLVAGSALDSSTFQNIELHAGSELVGHIATEVDLAQPGQLGRDLAAGEPLLRSDIHPPSDSDALRTIAVPVWRSTIAGLGLLVGDHVDLIGTDESGLVGFVVADAVISRLPGASTGGAFSSDSGRESWITVQVNDEQALDIALALRAGDLEVVRSTGASQLNVAQARVPQADLSGDSETAAPSATLEPVEQGVSGE